MYEAEVNYLFESIETLPQDISRRFEEFRDRVSARTLLPWGEHCTECVWPVCYKTCELYSPRTDGGCRQFVDGTVRIDHPEGLNPYLVKMRFKQWAKLWTVGTLELHTLTSAAGKERLNNAVGAVARNLPLPSALKGRVLRKINYVRRRSAEEAPMGGVTPDYFLLECYNPNSRTISLTFSVRIRESKDTRSFQSMISAFPGFSRHKILVSEISLSVDLRQAFEVEITPNDCDDTTMYFGMMDFVKERGDDVLKKHRLNGSAKWKCIVWDLDNTLWDGILIEDGPERIRIRQGVIDVIKETDQRGILHSIASKNNHDEAMNFLRLAGLDGYFLYPQISWQPKSQSIARIAELLNISSDTFAFVDDQLFEREEVKSALPKVALLDAADYQTIPSREECRVPVTAESRKRRTMYLSQQLRTAAHESFGGDYLRFLKESDIQLSIMPLNEASLPRVYELAQRTNQLNFSGNRYPLEQLRELLQTKFIESYVIKCTDKFGSYGTVGFAVVDTREPRLLDLMFSCRVQGKHVEHAVLAYLLKRFVQGLNRDFWANYRKTERNAPGGRVFDEIGFECIAETEGVSSLVFKKEGIILDEKIIAVVANEAD
jgi:FkbH-like protein